MKYYLKHTNLFQGIAAWAIIFGAFTSSTKYWWILFFIISIAIGSIDIFINKRQMRAAKTNNDKLIAESEK